MRIHISCMQSYNPFAVLEIHMYSYHSQVMWV